MATINEIFTKAVAHARSVLGDATEIIKKSNDKIVVKMDEIQKTKEESYKVSKEEKKAVYDGISNQLGAIETAIKDKEGVDTINIANPEAITGDLKSGLEDIITTLKEEVQNFDKEVIIKNDIGQLATLFKTSQDKKSIIKALDSVKEAVNDISYPEAMDITPWLTRLIEVMAETDSKGMMSILKEIRDKNTPFPVEMDVNLDPNLIEDDRVRTVLPDEQVAKMSTAIADSFQSDKIVNAIEEISDQQVADNIEGNGKVSVGVTAVEIPFTGKTESIIISADTSNTGTLYIGKSNVTTLGANAIAFLEAGESLEMDYNDSTNAVYVVASVASQNYWAGSLL